VDKFVVHSPINLGCWTTGKPVPNLTTVLQKPDALGVYNDKPVIHTPVAFLYF